MGNYIYAYNAQTMKLLLSVYVNYVQSIPTLHLKRGEAFKPRDAKKIAAQLRIFHFATARKKIAFCSQISKITDSFSERVRRKLCLS